MFSIAISLGLTGTFKILDKTPAEDYCGYDYTTYSWGCYKLYSIEQSFSAAQATCAGDRATLVDINDNEENAFIGGKRCHQYFLASQ